MREKRLLFSLESLEQKEISLTPEYSEEIYIYEIHDIQGLGVANSVKIEVDKEKSLRLNLDEVKIGKKSYWEIYVAAGVALVALIWTFRKKWKETFKNLALASGFKKVRIFSEFNLENKKKHSQNYHFIFHCYV